MARFNAFKGEGSCTSNRGYLPIPDFVCIWFWILYLLSDYCQSVVWWGWNPGWVVMVGRLGLRKLRDAEIFCASEESLKWLHSCTKDTKLLPHHVQSFCHLQLFEQTELITTQIYTEWPKVSGHLITPICGSFPNCPHWTSFGMERNTDCTPGFRDHHQCLISPIARGLNGQIPKVTLQKSSRKPSKKTGCYHSSKGCNTILKKFTFTGVRVRWCPETFSHIV